MASGSVISPGSGGLGGCEANSHTVCVYRAKGPRGAMPPAGANRGPQQERCCARPLGRCRLGQRPRAAWSRTTQSRPLQGRGLGEQVTRQAHRLSEGAQECGVDASWTAPNGNDGRPRPRSIPTSGRRCLRQPRRDRRRRRGPDRRPRPQGAWDATTRRLRPCPPRRRRPRRRRRRPGSRPRRS